MRFGSWVDCLRERALKYVKNLTTSPMVSVPFFIPNCTFYLLPQLPKYNTPLWLTVTLSWTQMHLHTRQTDSKQLQSWENIFTLQKRSWASQIEMKRMQTSELWESLNLSFLNSQHSDSILISMPHCSLGRQGIIFLLFPFYRWSSWSTARFIDLLRVAQHAWMEAEPQLAWFPLLGF